MSLVALGRDTRGRRERGRNTEDGFDFIVVEFVLRWWETTIVYLIQDSDDGAELVGMHLRDSCGGWGCVGIGCVCDFDAAAGRC